MEKLGFGDLVGSVGEDGAVAGNSLCKLRYFLSHSLTFPIFVSGGAVSGGPGELDNHGDGTSGSAITSPGESRRLSIQRCIQSLVHACQCRDANCRLPSCQKMKRVVQHAKSCKRRQGGPLVSGGGNQGCPICKQLIALCCYHAKHCDEQKCLVPYCPNIKYRLRQQQLQQKLQEHQILRRRIATMNNKSQSSQPSSQQHDYNSSPAQPAVSFSSIFTISHKTDSPQLFLPIATLYEARSGDSSSSWSITSSSKRPSCGCTSIEFLWKVRKGEGKINGNVLQPCTSILNHWT